MEKWVCSICGNTVYEKSKKNAVCGINGCKGRFRHYRKCKCGKWFEDFKYSKTYCSDKCSGRKRTNNIIGKVKIKCDNCGKEFLRYNSNIKSDKNFCCKECFNEYIKAEKEIRKCKYCGKEFYVFKSALKDSNISGNFCSQECYWKSMRIDTNKKRYYGFNKAKRKYFSGTQFCAICGTTKNIDIHHIIPNRLTQNQSKENLIPLCRKHHKIIENATKNFLNVYKDIDTAYYFLNNILRQRQMETMYLIYKNGGKNET